MNIMPEAEGVIGRIAPGGRGHDPAVASASTLLQRAGTIRVPWIWPALSATPPACSHGADSSGATTGDPARMLPLRNTSSEGRVRTRWTPRWDLWPMAQRAWWPILALCMPSMAAARRNAPRTAGRVGVPCPTEHATRTPSVPPRIGCHTECISAALDLACRPAFPTRAGCKAASDVTTDG